MQRKYFILLLITILVLAVATGCGAEGEDVDESVANSVSINTKSKYLDTFTELNLGEVLDFNLELNSSERNMVTIWVEGYRDGNPISQEPIGELSYRLSSEDDGLQAMGLGIFNHNFDSKLLIYSSGGKILLNPTTMEGYQLNKSGVSAGEYAIKGDSVALELGEEKLLAAYRQAEYSLKTVDYENEESISKMIAEDDFVLLLKIMIETIDEW